MKERIEWLDSCKGFTMILVVIGHIMDGYLNAGLFIEHTILMERIYNTIYSFHMPLFFFISGYIFDLAYLGTNINNATRFKSQVRNCIYIYFFWSCVQWIFKALFSSSVNNLFTVIDLIMIPVSPMSPYWYIYDLIFMYLIVWNLSKLELKSIAVFAVSLVLNVLFSLLDTQFVFPIDSIIKYFLFFYAGVMISHNNKIHINTGLYIFTAIVSLVSITLTFLLNERPSRYNNVVGILLAVAILSGILFSFERFILLRRSKTLNAIGKYSLEIYVTHCFITAGNRILLFRLNLTDFYINVAANFLLATFIPIGISIIMKKVNVHKIFFRPASFFAEQKHRKQS